MVDDADDWLFDSVALYQNLFMYDLQHGITDMDWTDENNVCIATSDGRKHELAELHLPEKLLKTCQEEAGLIKNRDFHMNAGCYCPNQIACLRHVPNSRLVATSPNTEICKVQFWKLSSDETDVIKNISTVENSRSKGSPAHIMPVRGTSNIVFGSHLDNLCIVDSITGKTTYNGLQRCEIISSMGFTDSNTLICCCQDTGDLVTFDLREDMAKVKHDHKNTISEGQKCFWTSTVTESGVYKLSSEGEVRKVEKHNWNIDVGRWYTELNPLSGFTSYLKIHAIPGNEDDTVYISGFDSNVYIFKLPLVSDVGGNTKRVVSKPFFQHEGHLQNGGSCMEAMNKVLTTVTHILHPRQQGIVLSAATDGSLHAWQINKCLDK